MQIWVRLPHKIYAIREEYRPKKAREKDALYDLSARVEFPEDINAPGLIPVIEVPPRSTKMVHLGFKVACLPGYEFQVRSRSGLAKKSIFVANGPGCVDENFRGEVCALIYNGSDTTYTIRNGDRVAQGGFQRLDDNDIIFVNEDELGETERGENGFGSSGR